MSQWIGVEVLGAIFWPPHPPPPPLQGEALWTDLVPPGCWQNWLWIACPDHGDLGHGRWYVLSRHGGWVNPRVWRAGNPQEQWRSRFPVFPTSHPWTPQEINLETSNIESVDPQKSSRPRPCKSNLQTLWRGGDGGASGGAPVGAAAPVGSAPPNAHASFRQ